MKKNNRLENVQKGNALLIVLIIVIVLIAAWYFLFFNKSGLPSSIYQTIYPTGTATPGPAGYNNVKDLDNASAQLDGTNLNQMDPGLNQVAADSSSF